MKKSDRSNQDFEATFRQLEQHMFLSAAMPMVMVDTDGIIIKINRAYEDWCGLSAKELVGSYMPDKIQTCRTHVVAQTGIPEIHCIQQAFGETILSTRLPIFDEDGKLIGAWAMVDVNNYQSMLELQRKIEHQRNSISKYQNELRTFISGKYWFTDILGRSPGIMKAKADAAAAAEAQIDVMIRGETGVGKELFAHAIHNSGPRSGGPFISLNCSALSPNLVEAELFGYEGGSFTDADKRGRQGKFEFANGGTLFLDEIGDMPVSIQPKLLRAIEAREITRVGGQKVIHLDLQIVAATNCDLERMVEQGVFRRDLYYRLSAYMVTIPPLRTRREDIPILVRHFLEIACRKTGRVMKPISEACMADIMTRSWRGNVRELSNFIRNMVIRTDPQEQFYGMSGAETPGFSETEEEADTEPLTDFEMAALRRALQRTRGNISRAAGLLQIDRNTVYRKMKKFGITREEFL